MVNVLGVIRPTVEAVPAMTKTGHVGILATPATVSSESYVLELNKISEGLIVTQQACPLWVPLIEAGEHNGPGAKYFIGKYLREILAKDPLIDTLVLGCTHYPLMKEKINQWLEFRHELDESEFPQPVDSPKITTIAQGELEAASLADYLQRHPEYREQLSQGGTCHYLTTENADRFSQSASIFIGSPVQAEHIDLN
jgi:glutamate racemase